MKALSSFCRIGLIALVLLGFGLLSLSMVNAAGQQSPASIPLMVERQSYKLIDNFNSGAPRPCYSANGALISNPCPILEDSYVKISYDVTKKTVITQASYAWLQKDLAGMDLTAWNFVWIIIRGKFGGEKIQVEFKDCKNPANYPKVKIDNYLAGGIKPYWRAVAIPLDAFKQQVTGWSWSCMDRLNIMASSEITSGNSEVYVDDIRLLPGEVILDNFNDFGFDRNELGGSSGPWCNVGTQTCDPTGIITPIQKDGLLKLSYSVDSATTEGGYWTQLISTSLLSQMNALRFKIHGQQGGEKVLAEFKDCGLFSSERVYSKINISDFIQDGITTAPRLAIIPLSAFVGGNSGPDWNCIDTLAFNVSGKSPFNSGHGTVSIDDITLIRTDAQTHLYPIIVDNFQDCDILNALTGVWEAGGGLVTTYTPPSYFNDYGCSYKMTYNTAPGGWTWTQLNRLNITGYDHLQLFVKGTTGHEIMEVCLTDLAGKAPCYPLSIIATNSWQLARIPLSRFTDEINIDLTRLSNLKFTFVLNTEPSEVYVDGISFIKLQESELPLIMKDYPLTELYVFNDNTGGNLTFVVRHQKTKTQIISCVVPNNTSQLCGSFSSGQYEIQAYTLCPGPNPPKSNYYAGGPQTTRVFCK